MSAAHLKGLIFALLAATALLLGGAFVVVGQAAGVAVVAVAAVAWAVCLLPGAGRLRGAPNALTLLLIAASAAAALLAAPARAWAYAGVVGVLAAWDLSLFWGRLESAPRVVATGELIAAHLRSLGIVVGAAVLAYPVAAIVDVRPNFELALLSGAALIFAVAYLVRLLRAEA